MRRAAVLIAYLALLLAADHFSSHREQLALGALTWAVLVFASRRLTALQQAQVVGVVCFATVGELTGSIIWGVYSLPAAQPAALRPAGAWPRVPGRALDSRRSLRTARPRASSRPRPSAAATWGLLGLFVLPRRDVAGAVGVPLLLVFLWRSRNRALYASVFLVVASLELYGTAHRDVAMGAHPPRASESPTATLRRASPRATSGST